MLVLGSVSSNLDNACCSELKSMSEQASEQKYNYSQVPHCTRFVALIQVKHIQRQIT